MNGLKPKNLRDKSLKNSMESAKEISAKVEKDRLEEALEFYRWLPISPYGSLNSSRNIALNEAMKGKENRVNGFVKGLGSIKREGKMEIILQAMVIGAFLLIIMWLFSIPFLPI
jgi:hypothetical protein